jgi:hypothetical protein
VAAGRPGGVTAARMEAEGLVGGHLCEAGVGELARQPLLWPALTSDQEAASLYLAQISTRG